MDGWKKYIKQISIKDLVNRGKSFLVRKVGMASTAVSSNAQDWYILSLRVFLLK